MHTLRRWLICIALLFAAQILIGNVFHELIHHATCHLADNDSDCPVCRIGMLPVQHPDLPDFTLYFLCGLLFAPLPYRTRPSASLTGPPAPQPTPRGPPCAFLPTSSFHVS